MRRRQHKLSVAVGESTRVESGGVDGTEGELIIV